MGPITRGRRIPGLSSNRERGRYSVKGCLCRGKGLDVRVLRVSRLELVDITVDEGGRLILVPAAADEVDQGIGVMLTLA